jgi:hypothetical protein
VRRECRCRRRLSITQFRVARASCGWDDRPTNSGQGILVELGPTLLVDIGFDPNYSSGGPDPVLAVRGVQALVDTGATASCIDSGLAMRLNLPIYDRQALSGVGDRHEVNMHLGHVFIPDLRKVITGQFYGVDLVAGGHSHHALIGRTFLQHFKFVYEGRTGKAWITDEA